MSYAPRTGPGPTSTMPKAADDSDLDIDIDSLDPENESDKKILELQLEIMKAKLKLQTAQKAKAQKTASLPPAVPLPSSNGQAPHPSRGRENNYAHAQAPQPFPGSSRRREVDIARSPPRVGSSAPQSSTAFKVIPNNSRSSKPSVTRPATRTQEAAPQKSSFNDRLNAQRSKELERVERIDRLAKLQESRSRGFDLSLVDSTESSAQLEENDNAPPAGAKGEPASASYDPYSALHLTKRNIPHTNLARLLDPYTLLSMKQLLKMVHAPNFDPPQPPEIPTEDFVLVGIVASKSAPREHQQREFGNKKVQVNKFMVLTLTDLDHEIDVYLFGDAFSRYWKLVPGTVIGIMNPGIMPPRGNTTGGKFGLKITGVNGGVAMVDEETVGSVIEIGVARDLTWCEAHKANGQQCGTWVNKRKTTVCEFHLNLQLEKTRKSRMSINTSYSSSLFTRPTASKPKGGSASKGTQLGRRHDKFLGETIYVAPPSGIAGGGVNSNRGTFSGSGTRQTAAPNAHMDPFLGFLDNADLLARAKTDAAKRKRETTLAKERQFAKQLASMGSGVGRTYLGVRTSDEMRGRVVDGDAAESGVGADKAGQQQQQHQAGQAQAGGQGACPASPPKPVLTAESLGLIRDPSEVLLASGYKRKRAVTGMTFAAPPSGRPLLGPGKTRTGTAPIGWSGAAKGGWGVGSQRVDKGKDRVSGESGESGPAVPDDEAESPRKKARVGTAGLLARALSARQVVAAAVQAGDDSDGELEIV